MDSAFWFTAQPHSSCSSDPQSSSLYDLFENYQGGFHSGDAHEKENHGHSHVTQFRKGSWFPSVFEAAVERRKANAPVIPTIHNPKRQKNVREWQLTTATLLDNPLESALDTMDTRVSLSERYAAIPQSTRLRHKRACGSIGYRHGRCSCLNDTLRKSVLVKLYRHRRLVSSLNEILDDEPDREDDDSESSSSSSSDEEEEELEILPLAGLKPGFEKALLQLDGGKNWNNSGTESGEVRVAVYTNDI